MRHAPGVLAEVAPVWLLEHMDPEWAERYEKRFSDFRLPKDEHQRVELAETIGTAGRRLLEEVYAQTNLPWVQELEAIQTARRVWIQHYHAHEQTTRLSGRSRTAALSSLDHVTLRCGSSLQPQEKHGLDWLQSAFHREV